IEKLEINLSWGQMNIVVEPVDQLQILASGDDESLKELRIEVDDKELVIEQPQFGMYKNINASKWLEVVIRIPKEMHIPIEVQSISGPISARDISGENIHIETVSGKVLLQNIEGKEIYIRSISGAIRCQKLTGRKLKLRTVSGKSVLEQINVQKASYGTVSGDVIMDCSHVFDKMEYNTVSGSLTIYGPMEKISILRRGFRGNVRTEGVTLVEEENHPTLKINSLTGDVSVISTKKE
ncbi:MAG: DUF4097 domain-containing protein, partial [Clostridiales bacterium]|nr:DUF4097 domain-containing protein [Clostridiales bacterium]